MARSSRVVGPRWFLCSAILESSLLVTDPQNEDRLQPEADRSPRRQVRDAGWLASKRSGAQRHPGQTAQNGPRKAPCGSPPSSRRRTPQVRTFVVNHSATTSLMVVQLVCSPVVQEFLQSVYRQGVVQWIWDGCCSSIKSSYVAIYTWT